MLLRSLYCSFVFVLSITVSTSCEVPWRSDDSRQRAGAESTASRSGEEGPAEKSPPAGSGEARSACSGETLDRFASRELPAYPEEQNAVERFVEFRDRCDGGLPDGIRDWFDSIDKEGVALPDLDSVEGMARRFESICAGDLDVSGGQRERSKNDRLNDIYGECKLSETDFVEEDVFQEATGRRAAAASAVIFDWLRASGADEELAQKTSKWLGGMGSEKELEPRDLELIARHHPDLQLPVSDIDDASMNKYPPLVLDADAVWREGEPVLQLDGSSDDREKLERHIRRHWNPSSLQSRAIGELYVAVDGRAPFELLPRLLGAARDAGYQKVQLLTYHDASFDAVGETVEPASVDGHFAAIPIRPNTKRDAEKQTRLGGTIRITREGHQIEGPDGPFSPRDGCADQGPTICLDTPDADNLADRYDWLELYRAAADIHESHPEVRAIEMTAPDDLPVRIWVKSVAAVFHQRQLRDAESLDDAAWDLNREGNARWMLRPALSIE